MATTKKYKVTVWMPKGSPIHPIIEATSASEAKRIAKAQYPDARSIGAVTEVR